MFKVSIWIYRLYFIYCFLARTCSVIPSVQRRDQMGGQSLYSLGLFSTKCDKVQLICNSWVER